MLRHRLSLAIVTLILLIGACGGSSTGEIQDPIAEVDATTSTSRNPTTSTTAPTTTTTTTATTTTTTALSPLEARQQFLADLDTSGWIAYEDSIIGWSIRYPSDWTVLEELPGNSLALETPDGNALFIISAAQDSMGDRDSSDYLRGNIGFSVDTGLLREPPDDKWFWLDHDFDHVEGPLDIAGVETSLGVDPSGNTLSDDLLAPVWWYGYYDPDTRPDYGYIMQTMGISPVVFQFADDIVLSFEPPGNQ